MRRPHSVQDQILSLVRQGCFQVTNMKAILISFAFMISVLFASQVMAQENVVVFENGNYMMVASTDILAFAQEVAAILDWTGTTPGVDRFYPLGRMMISSVSVLVEQTGADIPLYVQHFTLFRDQSCRQ